MRHHTRLLVAGVFVALALVVAAVVALAAGGDASDDSAQTRPDPRETPTATASPTPTATQTPSSTPTTDEMRPAPAPPASTNTPANSIAPGEPTPPCCKPTVVAPGGSPSLPPQPVPTRSQPPPPPVVSPPALPTPGVLPPEPGRENVPAPIDGLDVRVMESAPPQYVLHIQAGLPGGCARRAGYEVNRTGDTIAVRVMNSLPTGNVVCTAIYGTYELNLNLGSGFEPGKTYRVQVNDKSVSFKAQ